MPEDRISQLATDPFLMEYAQGACIDALPPVQQLIAPIVEVPDLTYHFKVFTRDARLVLPSTVRNIGGRASQIAAYVGDQTGELRINSIDGAPLSKDLGDDALKFWVADAMGMLADIRSQVTENNTITTAIANVTSTTTASWNEGADPVAQIDTLILALMLAAKTAGVGVVFGPGAWGLFKSNPRALEHSKGNLAYETNPSLFQGNAEYRTAYAIYDSTPEGVNQTIAFQFPTNSVLIFARSAKPSRRDPSYMKLFTLKKERLGFKLTGGADGRDLRVQLDFPQSLSVTNTTGAVLLNVTP